MDYLLVMINRSDRIRIISEIANRLGSNEWPLIDLTLRQFELPSADQWSGEKVAYIIEMIQCADNKCLVDLASHLGIASGDSITEIAFAYSEIEYLLQNIDKQKNMMIDVATGVLRIQEVNEEYKKVRTLIMSKLKMMRLQDPNIFSDLWSWHKRWSDGSLPTYVSRRSYISDLYQPLIDELEFLLHKAKTQQIVETTGWIKVDRVIEKIALALTNAYNEEDYQAVGLLCREVIISLAQATYQPEKHLSCDGGTPSNTDAKRMLDDYIATELSGSSHQELRKYVKDAYALAVFLQHKRNATFRDTALCVEATRSLVNSIAIISGQRDP